MSKRKQILLILAAMAVLLAALGILLGMVLSSEQQQNQPVAEDTVSGGEEVSSNVSRVSKFPPATYSTSWPESSKESQRIYVPDPPMPDNFEMDSPPPTKDELQPGAMEEVGYLTYAKPVLSLSDSPYRNDNDGVDDDPIIAQFTIPDEKWPSEGYDYYDTELISVQEALEADNLILLWQYDLDVMVKLQEPLRLPVQYYRVVDYEPVTVFGISERRPGIPRRFAVRDGVIQAVTL